MRMEHKEKMRKKCQYGSSTLWIGVLMVLISAGCKEIYNLPEEKDFISENINYQSKILEPVLGRTSLLGSVYTDNTTLSLSFKIINPGNGDGRPDTNLLKQRQVWLWSAAYE